MTKRIRVDFAWLSVDHDVWNPDVMRGLAEQLQAKLSQTVHCKLLGSDFMRCTVDYEVPSDFDPEVIREIDYRVRTQNIDS